MNASATSLGAKIRAMRRRQGMTQVRLAEKMGISGSYLNLIEHGRRPLTAPLLLKLAGIFDLNLQSFAPDSDESLNSNLMEVFGDPLFDGHALSNSDVQDLIAHSPGVARAVMTLYEGYREAREAARDLAGRVAPDPMGADAGPRHAPSWRLPSEEVSDLIQRHFNHFPDLEAAAETLWCDADLTLNDLHGGLVRHLRDVHGVQVRVAHTQSPDRAVRRYDPERRIITLSELVQPATRTFQLAHQIGLITQSPLLDRFAADPHLSTDASRTLCRVAMANYFAGAVVMPYALFLDAAQALRYDAEVLGRRFQASFEQVCHRLTTLRRPGAEGIPFHFLKVDIAGNISKRFSASGIPFARFSGACPRWNLVAAFMTPGRIRRQLSQMPDGSVYFCIARTVSKHTGGYYGQSTIHAITLGCSIPHARQMLYTDGMNLDNTDAAVPIGVTCRLCDRTDCEQRVLPTMTRPLHIDENKRGFSFYAPPKD